MSEIEEMLTGGQAALLAEALASQLVETETEIERAASILDAATALLDEADRAGKAGATRIAKTGEAMAWVYRGALLALKRTGDISWLRIAIEQGGRDD